MTELQLKLFNRADKHLTMGSHFFTKEWGEFNYHVAVSTSVSKEGKYEAVSCDGYDIFDTVEEYQILGKPITYGRLCYLSEVNENKTADNIGSYVRMSLKFREDPKMIEKNHLDRSDDLNKLVLDFLQSLPKQ